MNVRKRDGVKAGVEGEGFGERFDVEPARVRLGRRPDQDEGQPDSDGEAHGSSLRPCHRL